MATITAELEAAISAFISRLGKGIRVDLVVLFGSYVRGMPHQESDIDLAVGSPDFEGMPRWRRQEMIAALTLDRQPNIAPIGYSCSQWRDPAAILSFARSSAPAASRSPPVSH